MLEHWKADFDERYPIYVQIVERFSRALVRAELSAGDRIPSIRELALSLRVNTNTVAHAYQALESSGLIRAQRGLGYFVQDDPGLGARVRREMVEQAGARYLEEMRALGVWGDELLEGIKRQMEEVEKSGADDD